jgi:hypothetical protein
LAELLPNRTLPELLFLETKWASLMSYGMTSDLLQEVLPIDELVNTFSIRRHVTNVAERLERELADEHFYFIEGCENSWDQLPPPDGPLTVGIDGGYVRGQHKQGAFEARQRVSSVECVAEPAPFPRNTVAGHITVRSASDETSRAMSSAWCA